MQTASAVKEYQRHHQLKLDSNISRSLDQQFRSLLTLPTSPGKFHIKLLVLFGGIVSKDRLLTFVIFLFVEDIKNWCPDKTFCFTYNHPLPYPYHITL